MREGWEKGLLKDVTTLKSGKTVSKEIERDFGEVIYTKVGDMNLEGNEVNITTSTRYVDFKDIDKKQIIPIGSVIFPKRGGAIATNKKRKVIKPTIVDLNTMAIVPSQKIHSEYLFHWFKSIDLKELSNGANVPQINNNSFDNTYIQFPKSLKEQKQIVALLDQAFEAIDLAKANIEQNIENAKELFQSKLNQIFSQRGEGWEETTLGEICEKTKNIKWQDYTNEEFYYVDLSSVSRESLEVTETTKVNKDNAPSRAKKIINEGDIIFATTRPTLKRATIIDSELDGQLCSTGYTVLRPKDDITSDWIFFYLLTNTFMDRMESLQRGASYPAVTDSDVKGSKLSVPLSKDVEDRYISLMNQLRSHTNDLIIQYQLKLNELGELKKSVLQKAFTGQLTRKEVEV